MKNDENVHFYCPDATCRYATEEVDPATLYGAPENPGHNCPECDKQLIMSTTVHMRDDVVRFNDGVS